MPVFVEKDSIPRIAPRRYEELMLRDHPQLEASTQHLLGLVQERARRLERPARIMVLGFVTEHFAERLRTLLPEAVILAHQFEAEGLAELRERFLGTSIDVLPEPDLPPGLAPVDVLVSRGHHHHMPRGALRQLGGIVAAHGAFIVGDEFCPEYCDEADRRRVAGAELIYLANGYVLTQPAEVRAFEERGEIPDAAVEMERRRRRALWIWYRHVVDHAMARDGLEVAIAELRSAHDDLITTCGGEHKLSPVLFEREMALSGFHCRSKEVMEPDLAELQSLIVYELAQGDPDSEGGLGRSPISA